MRAFQYCSLFSLCVYCLSLPTDSHNAITISVKTANTHTSGFVVLKQTAAKQKVMRLKLMQASTMAFSISLETWLLTLTTLKGIAQEKVNTTFPLCMEYYT